MNLAQRIVLIVGATLLVGILVGTESHRYLSNGQWNDVWFWQAALVRGLIFCVAIAAVYFAVGKKKP